MPNPSHLSRILLLTVATACARGATYETASPEEVAADSISQVVVADSAVIAPMQAGPGSQVQLQSVAPARTVSLHETIPVKPFEMYPYIKRVMEIDEYFRSASIPDNPTYNERLRRRNREIRQLLGNTLRSREIGRWSEHQVFQARDTKCKNSRKGKTKTCPWETLDWGRDYEVIPASLVHTRRHFKAGPVITPAYQVRWRIGKAGKGTNHGHVKATARLTSAAVDRGLERDREALRRELAARSLPTDRAIDPTEP